MESAICLQTVSIVEGSCQAATKLCFASSAQDESLEQGLGMRVAYRLLPQVRFEIDLPVQLTHVWAPS